MRLGGRAPTDTQRVGRYVSAGIQSLPVFRFLALHRFERRGFHGSLHGRLGNRVDTEAAENRVERPGRVLHQLLVSHDGEMRVPLGDDRTPHIHVAENRAEPSLFVTNEGREGEVDQVCLRSQMMVMADDHFPRIAEK